MTTQQQMAVSAMSELPANKAELQDYCSIVKSAALSGNDDIIEVAKKVNIMGRIVDFFEKDPDIQSTLLSEAEKYGKGERNDLQIKEVGTKYDFLSCGHSKYNRLYEKKKQIEAEMKEIEATLKLRDITEVDTDTGELIESKKATKTSTTKVIITIK